MAKQAKAKEAHWVVTPRGERVYTVAHAQATVRGNSTVDADLTRLEKQIHSGGSFTVTHAVLNPDAWVEDENGVWAVIPVTGMTEDTLPLVWVEHEDRDTARQCGLQDNCTSGDGILTVWSTMLPKALIRLRILAMFGQQIEHSVEVERPDTPGLTHYSLPVATKDTLGGVKIGENIDVAEDGTISAKVGSGCNHVLSGGIDDGSNHHVHDDECIQGLLATPGEVRDALNRALGIDADTGDDWSEVTPPDVSDDSEEENDNG